VERVLFPGSFSFQKVATEVADISCEGVVTVQIEAQTSSSSLVGGTCLANGANQDIPGSQHVHPQSQKPSAGSYPSRYDPAPQFKRLDYCRSS